MAVVAAVVEPIDPFSCNREPRMSGDVGGKWSGLTESGNTHHGAPNNFSGRQERV